MTDRIPKDIEKMKPYCGVGLFGSSLAIETLWGYVYNLKLRVEKLENKNGIIRKKKKVETVKEIEIETTLKPRVKYADRFPED